MNEKIKGQILNIYRDNPNTGLVEFIIELERTIKDHQPAEVAATLAAMINTK